MNWRELWLYCRVILTPAVWLRYKRADPYWDHIIRTLISQGEKPRNSNKHTFELGKYSVWKANGLYSLGNSWDIKIQSAVPDNLFTTRRTALLLNDLLKKERTKASVEPPQWFKDFERDNTKLKRALK